MSRRGPEFDLSDYDHRGELKIPRPLVVVLAFLGRYPLLLAIHGLSTFILSRRGLQFEGLGFPPPEALLASVPALVLLAVILLREKLAGKAWALALQRHGIAVAVATCAWQLTLIGRLAWLEGEASLNRVVVEGLLVIYCAAYLLRSAKARYYLRLKGTPAESAPNA